jgi:signal transduction histidine kinase
VAVVAAWAVYAVIYGLVLAATGDVPLRWALQGQVVLTGVLAALSVIPWLLVVRGLDGRPWGWALAAHAVLLPLYAVGGVALYVPLLGAVSGPAAEEAVRAEFGWIAFGAGIAYAVQFAGYHAALEAKRSRLRSRQAVEALALAREGELQALRAQLNPHFLFNALNAVSAEVGRDPHEARELLATLGDLLRYALDSGEHDLVPLSDELAFARGYLDMEARRMGDRLCVRWDVDEGALAAGVPPMALQTLVENAVCHGLAPSPAGGTIYVEVRQEGPDVRIAVRDTGVGTSSRELEPGVGLANADERLRLLFGQGGALQLLSSPEGGFEAGFVVPATTHPTPAHPHEPVLL